ncbi:hypothetical protein LNN35_21505 [Pseudomonas stutzeri]|uniref:Uncharacterized protein n=2 Tax=Stutzerimonas stutzeri TaxID=316 RepID=A0A0D7E2W6_STUST|nr:hypothetical protein [Stutzerimonas stutzeri]KIZ34856.1 hypothetical protein LO50_15815 [Stutzerimonas stutzeri]MCC8345343.1 hypothetical protein [Stutzerimonas stutzeri]RRV76508.1 hypothetical protein EGI92_19575 [Stutzerimonas stutzeri]
MKTFEAGCKAYHAANSELEAHYGSEQGIEIRNKVPHVDLSLYLDLSNTPHAYALPAIAAAQKASLDEQGPDFTKKYEAFKNRTEMLVQARYQAFCDALGLLGEEMGAEYKFNTSGPLDQRIADVLTKGDLLRKTLLDGFGYVDLLDLESSFSKGFFTVTGLTKIKLYNDLKLCSQIREGGIRISAEERVRLGFHQE